MDNQSQDEKLGRKTKESLIFCSTKALEGLVGNYAIRTQEAQTSKLNLVLQRDCLIKYRKEGAHNQCFY